MSTESFHEAVKFTAPTTGETTAPAVEDNTSAGQEPPEDRVFTQAELDAIVQKRLGIEQRKWQREQTQGAEQAQPRVNAEPPKPEEFKTPAEYVDALADWKADQKLAQSEANKQKKQVESTYFDREEKAREKYEDFHTVVYRDPKDGGPAISDVMHGAIMESDIGPEIAYHLGKNPDEALRIYRLGPLAQAREIGKLEASLIANPPAKKPSSAPEPITPVGSRSASPNYSASDPRSLKMSMEDWAAARAKEKAKSR